MSEPGEQSEPRRTTKWRAVPWLLTFVFTCLAAGWAVLRLPSALQEVGWQKPEGLVLLYAVVLSAGPLFVALGLIYLLWKRLGPPSSHSRARASRSRMKLRTEGAVDPTADFRRKFLWSVAVVFLCFAAYRVRYWIPNIGYELSGPTSSLEEIVQLAVREGVPLLLLAICGIAILWRILGPPFSLQRRRGAGRGGVIDPSVPEVRHPSTGRDPVGDPPGPRAPRSRSVALDSRRAFDPGGGELATEPRAKSEAKMSTKQRAALWLFTFVFVGLASGWALIWLSCALDGWGWAPADGGGLVVMVVISIAPLLAAIGLIVFLWTTVGPPFSRPRER
jgi:hypothetical protein